MTRSAKFLGASSNCSHFASITTINSEGAKSRLEATGAVAFCRSYTAEAAEERSRSPPGAQAEQSPSRGDKDDDHAAAICARFSSDLQDLHSIADQVDLARRRRGGAGRSAG